MLILALATESVTLVTPNRRLAFFYKREFDFAMQAKGLKAWPTPDILPFTAFVERTWRAFSLDAGGVPLRLLDGVQSQLIWEQVIRKSDEGQANALMNVAQTARQAAAAWVLANAWQLLPAMQKIALSDDALLFLAWSKRYREICRERGMLDAATLPDALAAQVQSHAGVKNVLPHRLLLSGFDIVTPQQHYLWRIFRGSGIAAEVIEYSHRRIAHPPSRIEFETEQEELRACARWARQQLQTNPSQSIAIVVPDLQGRRSDFSRELNDALMPTQRAQGPSRATAASPLFNISLGQALGDYALVRDALAMLEFSLLRPMPFLEVSALLRSPYIIGAESELSARAHLDARLREHAAPAIALGLLRQCLSATGPVHSAAIACRTLVELIEKVFALAAASTIKARGKTLPTSPHDWSRHFGRVLMACGFPGQRSPDSMEYQVLGKFRDAIASLSTLAAVQPRMRAEDALLQLRRIVADTMFQPEAESKGHAPIQVLGVLESAGQAFDALWVTGLNDAAWPLVTRSNPFIPAALQRAAGVPEASAAASLALDTRITQAWLTCSPQVVLSHARTEGAAASDEQKREASALIRDIVEVSLAAILREAVPSSYAEALQTIGAREVIADGVLEPLSVPATVRGGATLIRDQAACPFRAFARHRLAAKPLATPHTGPDALERGNLLHRVLFLVWGQLENHSTLAALDETGNAKIVDSAATQAVNELHAQGMENLAGRFAELEKARLRRVVMAWLNYERQRAPFTVVGREVPRKVTLGGLRMDLRLDRMDRFADGTHALIDYKTGMAKSASWLGERLDEPQLPLYCHTAGEHISALAFARVKLGQSGKDFGFEGLSAIKGLLTGVVPIEQKPRLKKLGYDSWDVLTQEWDSTLNSLAQDFVQGRAKVDPKYGALTCKQCDLQGVCRVAELSPDAALEIESGMAEDSDV